MKHLLFFILFSIFFTALSFAQNVWILNDGDDDIFDPPFDDSLKVFLADGTKIMATNNFNIDQTLSGSRAISVTGDGLHCWVSDVAGFATDSLLKIDINGNRIAGVAGRITATDIDENDLIYALTSSGSLYGENLLVFDGNGRKVDSVDFGGWDLAVDYKHASLWLVGADIKRLNLNLETQLVVDSIEWASTSVDFTAEGGAWVAETGIPQVPGSANKVMHVTPDGSFIDAVDLSSRPNCVRVDRADGSVWIASDTFYKYNPGTSQLTVIDSVLGHTVTVDQYNNLIWLATYSDLRSYSKEGVLQSVIGNFSGNSQKYVATANERLFKILSVEDVPNDEGRAVRMQWARHPVDGPNPHGIEISHYSIWRERNPDLLRHKTSTTPEGEWDFVKEVPAVQEEIYSTIVPTLADSNGINGLVNSTFFVRAHTADVAVHYETYAASGYSIDNLSLSQVSGLQISLNEQNNIYLQWNENQAANFAYYIIYRDTLSNFVPQIGINSIAITQSSAFIDNNFSPGKLYFYIVTAVDNNGKQSPFSDPVSIIVSAIGGQKTPLTFELGQNYPNPFNPLTTIRYQLAKTSLVELSIYDMLGQKVATLVSQKQPAGKYSVLWDAVAYSSGVYLYRLETDQGFVQSKRLILLK